MKGFFGLSGFHVSHLPGWIDGHLLVLKEDVAVAHDFHHPTNESPSSAIRTHHLSCMPFLLDSPLDRSEPTPFFLLPLLQSLLEPLAALHHLRLHNLHKRSFPSTRITCQPIPALQLHCMLVHLGAQSVFHLYFLVEHVAVGTDDLVLDPIEGMLFHYLLWSSPHLYKRIQSSPIWGGG